MTIFILEVDTEQKKALKGILKYLKVSFQEQKPKKINARDFAQKIDYGINPNKEIDAKQFSKIENSAEEMSIYEVEEYELKPNF